MSIVDLARREIRELVPYSSARSEAPGRGVLLNANESAEGVLNRYPDQQPAQLLEALSSYYSVDADQILVGRGSDEAIDVIVRTFGEPGTRVVTTPPTFGMYEIVSRIQGLEVTQVPLMEGWEPDVDGILEANPRIVFICSPNNPTSNLMERDSVRRIVEELRGKAVVVIDEAYIEFARADSWSAELSGNEHLIVLRTMSKAHAIAAARIGVALAAPEVVRLLRKVLPPYPLPKPSTDAALAALGKPLLERTRLRIEKTLTIRKSVSDRLETMKIVEKVWPSDANFLLVKFRDAERVARITRDSGILIRDFANLPGHLRITIGALEEMEALLDILERID